MLASWKIIPVVISITTAVVAIIKLAQQIRFSPSQNSLPNKFILNQIQPINERTM